jgi:hypothetical protein
MQCLLSEQIPIPSVHRRHARHSSRGVDFRAPRTLNSGDRKMSGAPYDAITRALYIGCAQRVTPGQ